MKPLFFILCLISIFLSSCGISQIITPSNPIVTANTETPTPSITFTPIPTETVLPTPSPTITPTSTPRADNEPGFIVLFGEQVSSHGSSLVFSPDGKIIAQANSSVKLWDVDTHALIRELKHPYPEKYYATKALFSPDGSLIAINITDYLADDGSPNGHLLIWDVSSGDLLQDWMQEFATMIDPNQEPYYISVNAMAFLPNSTKLAYANGNDVEIQDARHGDTIDVFSLGKEMYASEISIRDDAEFLYVVMEWYKGNTFPALYKSKFKVQIWHLNTKSLRREIKYPESSFFYERIYLVGTLLLYENEIEGTLKVKNLSTDENEDFPYRTGWKYFNSDASLMLCVRYIGVEIDEQSLELWNTDIWRNIYTFKPVFMNNWYFFKSVAFNPDNSLLAIDYDGQVSLWDIRANVQP